MKLVCVVLVLSLNHLINSATSSFLRLLPDDPDIIVGHNLVMNCSSQSKQFSAYDLAFEIRPYVRPSRRISTITPPSHTNERNVISVPQRFIYILHNSTTALLNYTNISQRLDRATVLCYRIGHRGNDRFTDKQILKVGYPPAKPVIDDYRVIDWNEFIFKWTLPYTDTGYHTEYTAWFRFPGFKDFNSCRFCNGEQSECPKQDNINHSCRINRALHLAHPSGYVEIKVNGSNDFGETSSETVRLDLYNHIQPGPVKDLDVRDNGSGPPDAVFKSPMLHRDRGTKLYYNVSVQCGSYHLELPLLKSGKKDVHQSLTGLPSYKQCVVSVTCKPDYIERHRGYWSDVVSKQFLSQVGVPPVGARTCRSCFKAVLKESSYREVSVYYQQLEPVEALGNITEYRATELSKQENKQNGSTLYTVCSRTTPNKSTIHLSLLADQSYVIAVEASTIAGYNDALLNYSTVFVPISRNVLDCNLNMTVLNIGNGFVNISWNRHPYDVNYVVVWCTGIRNTMHCTGNFNWRTVPQSHENTYIHQVKVAGTPGSITDYLFGLSVESTSSSSGIHWSDCTYNARKPANKPHVSVKTEARTSLTLDIKQDTCEQDAFGYANGYTIYLVRPLGPPVVEFIDLSQLDSHTYTVYHLDPETEYTVLVESHSLAGPSHSNSTSTKARTHLRGLTSANITLIVLGSVVGLALVVAGVVTCYRMCRHGWRKFVGYCKVNVRIPDLTNDYNSCSHELKEHPGYSNLRTHIVIEDMLDHEPLDRRDESEPPDGCATPENDLLVREPLLKAPSCADNELVQEGSAERCETVTCAHGNTVDAIPVESDEAIEADESLRGTTDKLLCTAGELDKPLSVLALEGDEDYSVCEARVESVFEAVPVDTLPVVSDDGQPRDEITCHESGTGTGSAESDSASLDDDEEDVINEPVGYQKTSFFSPSGKTEEADSEELEKISIDSCQSLESGRSARSGPGQLGDYSFATPGPLVLQTPVILDDSIDSPAELAMQPVESVETEGTVASLRMLPPVDTELAVESEWQNLVETDSSELTLEQGPTEYGDS